MRLQETLQQAKLINTDRDQVIGECAGGGGGGGRVEADNKGTQRNPWGDENAQCFDCDGGSMGMYLCQSSVNYILKMEIFHLMKIIFIKLIFKKPTNHRSL